ncbi:MAG: carotenoid 1,2-hydratase [Nitrospirota bacterium]|nr:carotenoid 1,2-hydratase [Nitrospirota bacterium]MDH5587176.1 carotenoid 1,2-hydratase [Nitrospirota bacterium]MDH5775002.1 carotenoid 1,2-hydratase [Nitrospirota bacterium]
MLKVILVLMMCGICPNIVVADSTPGTSRFSLAKPGYTYVFPRDHGSHDQFQTEWWYFTGHVSGSDGRRFGYELTFFRRGIDSPHVWNNPSEWAMRHLYLAHFALTDEDADQFRVAEKMSRAGIHKAGAQSDVLDVWIDQWHVKAVSPDHRRFHLQAEAEDFSIDFTVESQKPPVMHGAHGVSAKGQEPGQASHYYSLTRLRTTGSVRVGRTTMAVNGMSWMDHEFGSGELADHLVGWDWFSLQLDNDHEIMAYGLRRVDGTFDPASSGTFVLPDGTSRALALSDFQISVDRHWMSPLSGARYPHHWTLVLPSEGIKLSLSPRMANQELVTTRSTNVTYWEGAIDVTGQWKGQDIQGQGYVELTGYAKPYDVKGEALGVRSKK